jgi:hypothetical protein
VSTNPDAGASINNYPTLFDFIPTFRCTHFNFTGAPISLQQHVFLSTYLDQPRPASQHCSNHPGYLHHHINDSRAAPVGRQSRSLTFSTLVAMHRPFAPSLLMFQNHTHPERTDLAPHFILLHILTPSQSQFILTLTSCTATRSPVRIITGQFQPTS